MRRLHQHGVSGLDAGVQISEHFRKRARAHDALGIHAGALSGVGYVQGQLAHAHEPVERQRGGETPPRLRSGSVAANSPMPAWQAGA